MEEKERYYSLIDNNGNFELIDYESNNDIHSLYELDDLLNQQDKRIKELEEENKILRELLELERRFNDVYMTINSRLRREMEKIKRELRNDECV